MTQNTKMKYSPDKTKNQKSQLVFSLFFAIDLLVLDIVTKRLAIMKEGGEIEIIGKFFWLEFYHINTGIAFGLPVPYWFQILATFGILGFLFYLSKDWIFKNPKHPFLNSLLFGMILGGAVGNLIDRLLKGYVIDFIHLSFIPTFNIADVGIVLGMLGIVILNYQKNT